MQAFQGGEDGPGKSCVQKGHRLYFLRVIQPSKKIKETLNCMIQVLGKP